MNSGVEAEMKAGIAHKIIEELAKVGRLCDPQELEHLVETEYRRICKELYGISGTSDWQQQQQPPVDQKPVLPPPEHFQQQQDEVDVKPDLSSLNASLLDQIDWTEIQNVISQSGGMHRIMDILLFQSDTLLLQLYKMFQPGKALWLRLHRPHRWKQLTRSKRQDRHDKLKLLIATLVGPRFPPLPWPPALLLKCLKVLLRNRLVSSWQL